MATMLSLILLASTSPIEVEFRPRTGLFFDAAGVSLSQGSFIQYYKPGWSRGYYSTNWNDQTVTKTANGSKVTFKSSDGRVDGTVTIEKTPNGFTADYNLAWNGNEAANVEVSFAHLWAPAFEAGKVLVDGRETRRPSVRLPIGNDPKIRFFGGEGTTFQFDAPFATLQAKVIGATAYVFDGRGYTGDFAQNRELFWFGLSDVPTSPGKPAKFQVEWTFTPKKVVSAPDIKNIATKATSLPSAKAPRTTTLPMVPQPKEHRTLTGDGYRWMDFRLVRLTQQWAAPLAFLHSRFDLSTYAPKNTGAWTWSKADQMLPAGGYTLRVEGGKLSVIGQDDEGMRNGMMRAVGLTTVKNGELIIPPVEIRDWPSNGWRGLHMFVGPKAPEFQGRMTDRLLTPLMFNQVVLQCERTAWDSTPGTSVGLTMSKPDLARLFAQYRSSGIEPTPLIQSFGHMEWLFQNNKNLDIALNPKVPYAIDPRNPKSRTLLSKIWSEAVALLNPKILHFGLDEVDMRGMPDDDQLVTDLWNLHVPWLGELAKSHGKEMMIWGDQMLAPGEAPDAALGDAKAHAAARRSVLPKGTWIADWHYINNANPAIYKSLELFKNAGMKPVATSWNRPENIKGFFKAAESQGGAVLQSTWAGYESTEQNMLRESSQFVAYLLAGEYAWSGRSELARDLPYQPSALFQRLMYAEPSPLKARAGAALSWSPSGTKLVIGDYEFAKQAPISLYDPLTAIGVKQPKSIALSTPGLKSNSLVAAISVRSPLDELAEVATVVVKFADGKTKLFPVRYGQHVRVARENRSPMVSAASEGISAVLCDFSEIESRPVEVKMVGKVFTAGVQLHGITAF